MTFLPIVGREMRAAARRRGTYAVRLVVAQVAILTGAIIFLIYLDMPPAAVGHALFIGLSILAMVYCLLAGRMATADCLSQEKREGTLGLLFLTDLKGYDVVLGKLVATSVGAFYGLLALMPVLAVPLLLGGSSNAEFWRVVVVLVTTFLFSLAVGMLGSAMSRDARRAMGANFALMILLVLAMPFVVSVAVALISNPAGPDEIFAPSPIFSCCYAFDSLYGTKFGRPFFWWSIGLVFGLTLLTLWLTSAIVPRTWQDKSAPQVRSRRLTWRGFWRALSYGRLKKQASHRKRLLDVNAFYWLAARARLKPLHVWIFMGFTVLWWTWGWIDAGIVWYDPLIAITLAMILNSTFKSWVAIEAGQQLAEDKDVGALELLLSTPMTVRDILYGQFLALRRHFLKPLLIVIAVELIFMEAEAQYGGPNSLPVGMARPLWLAGIFILLADVVTLAVVAIRTALTARSVNRATISTMSRILFLPWVVVAIGSGMANLWAALFANNGYLPGLKTYVGLWFGASLAVDLFFGLRAWKQLRGRFRDIASRQYAATATPVGDSIPVQGLGSAQPTRGPLAALADAAEALAPASSHARRNLRWGGVLVTLVASVTAWHYWSKPKYPPPVIVSITQSNGPIHVIGGLGNSGLLLVLPDESLWRWGAAGTSPGVVGSQLPQSRAAAPEKAGTNYDWLQISEFGNHSLGIRKDGTLWEWGWIARLGRPRNFQAQPIQVGSESNWRSVSTGGRHDVAIRKDGTLWAWGDKSGSPVQVDRGSDWIDARCDWFTTFGLRKDGTLWVWREKTSTNGMKDPDYGQPMLMCRDTNWVNLESGVGLASPGAGLAVWARNRLGEVREPLSSLANSEADAATTCPLIASENVPGNLIWAYFGAVKLYDLRADGTLWEKSYGPNGSRAPIDDWHRFGRRSDWVGIWSAWGTAIGLTADGTVWMWGLDYSRQPTRSFSERLAMLQVEIKQWLGNRPPRRGLVPGPLEPPIQKTPRPLMRLVFDPAGGTNAVTSREQSRSRSDQ